MSTLRTCLVALVHRAWARWLLRRSLCEWCDAPLLGDGPARFCSEQCEYENWVMSVS